MDPEPFNPYASPQTVDEPVSEPDWPAWNDAGVIVTRPKSVLPQRCYVCNGPGDHRQLVRRTGWMSLRGVVNVSVLAHLCDLHHSRQRVISVLKFAAVVVAFVIVPTIADMLTGVAAGVLLWIVAGGVFVALYRASNTWAGQPLTVAHAEPRAARLKGAGSEYTQSLPSEPPQ